MRSISSGGSARASGAVEGENGPVSFNPRTVRRYLNGERRPDCDTVVRWEQVCKAAPGTLVALDDGAPASDVPPARSRARLAFRSAVAAVVVVVALGAVLLLHGGDEPRELHRVTLRWGENRQQVVTPAAMIAFGERNVPAGALDINESWKTAG